MGRILNWFMAKWFIDAVKEIEKQNNMTKILKACFKQKIVKDNWIGFLTGVERLLNDAESEASEAKSWV